MKRRFLTILSLASILLSGCSGIYANFRELEHIRVIQTIGLDYIPGGVLLTLSSANVEKDDEEALCLSGYGSTISEALKHIRITSSQDDLFLSQVKQILIGEEAAKQGLEPYFSYICRTGNLRIDTPVFIVKGKTAKETMTGSHSGGRGISEILQALQNTESEQYNSRISSASEVINNMEKYGSSLVSLIEYTRSSENLKAQEQEKEMTAALAGYAVIKDSKLIAYIDSENALGADYLLNRSGISDIVISDTEGNPVSMEIDSVKRELKPVWENKTLKGIELYIKLNSTIIELQDNVNTPELSDYLLSQLESAVSDRAAYVLQLSRKLQSDFLGIAGDVKMQNPEKYRSLGNNFEDIIPKLQMKISVSASLSHSQDVKDGQS